LVKGLVSLAQWIRVFGMAMFFFPRFASDVACPCWLMDDTCPRAHRPRSKGDAVQWESRSRVSVSRCQMQQWLKTEIVPLHRLEGDLWLVITADGRHDLRSTEYRCSSRREGRYFCRRHTRGCDWERGCFRERFVSCGSKRYRNEVDHLQAGTKVIWGLGQERHACSQLFGGR
jgi:hypothetical protein